MYTYCTPSSASTLRKTPLLSHVNVELSRISETDMVSDMSVSSALRVKLLLTLHHLQLEDLLDIQARDVIAWTLFE